MIYVAAYCRVSTEKDDQANSFAAQQQYFRTYIEGNPDWALYAIYADEGISGTSTRKRVQFHRMMEDALQGKFQLILTKEVSRFSRNIVDTLSYTRELKRIGVAVEFVTDHINTMDGDGELRLSIMATMAQDESRKTSRRVVWGQTRRMEQGVVFGRSLLGYEVKDGSLTIEPEGAELVRLIFQKYAVEQMSAAALARFLTRAGYRTYRGGSQWKAAAILKILHNEKYVGDLVQKKTYTPDYLTHEKRRNSGQVPQIRIENHHTPIISREVWNLAQARMQQNNKHGSGGGGHSNRYVFSGKIKCGQCGASFVGRVKTLRDGSRVRRWSCGTAVRAGSAGCGIGRLVRDDDAMQMLHTAVRNLRLDVQGVIGNVAALALDAMLEGETGAADAPERLAYELERLGQKRGAALDRYLAGDITREDMLALKQRYEAQAEALELRLRQAEARQQQGHTARQRKEALRAELAAILDGRTESEVFSKTLLHSLTVFPDRRLELRLNDLPQVFHFSG